MSAFERALRLARCFERGVCGWLKSRGHLVLPTCEYAGDGHAPVLEGRDEDIVLPDLMVFRQLKMGEAYWVEVKTKSSTQHNAISGLRVTGFDLPAWNNYVHMRRVSGRPVWLLFCHVKEDELLAAEVEDLHHARVINGTEHRFGSRGGVFFACEGMARLGPLSQILRHMPPEDRALVFERWPALAQLDLFTTPANEQQQKGVSP